MVCGRAIYLDTFLSLCGGAPGLVSRRRHELDHPAAGSVGGLDWLGCSIADGRTGAGV